jgi:lysylphosphatidylglycerol synthetase-like protein (DUF2156 family)
MTELGQYDVCVAEMTSLVDKRIRPVNQWYWDHARSPRIWFRVCGVVVVVGSLLLPVITTFKTLPHHDWVLAAVSVTVAILTSLGTFFQWDAAWKNNIKAGMELQALLAKWDLNIARAKYAEDPRKAALDSTELLFDEAFKVTGAETVDFFASLKSPNALVLRSGQ